MLIIFIKYSIFSILRGLIIPFISSVPSISHAKRQPEKRPISFQPLQKFFKIIGQRRIKLHIFTRPRMYKTDFFKDSAQVAAENM